MVVVVLSFVVVYTKGSAFLLWVVVNKGIETNTSTFRKTAQSLFRHYFNFNQWCHVV